MIPELRSKQAIQIIGKKCPSVIKTRWMYIYDVLNFMLRNKEKIENFYIIKNSEDSESINYIEKITKEMNFIYMLLFPLRMLILIFEKKNASLCSLIPLVKEYFEMMKDLKTKMGKVQNYLIDIFKELLLRVISRIKNISPEAVITSYVLTASGRADLRQRAKGILTQNPDCLSFGYYHQTLRDMKKYYDELLDQESLEYEYEEFIEDKNSDYENNSDYESTEEFDGCDTGNLEKMTVDELLSLDLFLNLFTTALGTLQKYSKLLRPNLDDNTIKEKLMIFLFEDPLIYPFTNNLVKNPNEF